MSTSNTPSGFQVAGSFKRQLRQFVVEVGLTPVQRLYTPLRIAMNRNRAVRHLEIGPGSRRIPGFETLNVVGGRNIDYIVNAENRLPFADGTFDVIYASHIIEHIPWFRLEQTFVEWARVLKPGGVLEVWTPDGLKIAKAFVEAESDDDQAYRQDGWWRFNAEQDPCKWFSGRLFSYGDGTGRLNHPNWHRSAFSERFVAKLMAGAGLDDIRRMSSTEVRGYDHGWINLGMQGRRP